MKKIKMKLSISKLNKASKNYDVKVLACNNCACRYDPNDPGFNTFLGTRAHIYYGWWEYAKFQQYKEEIIIYQIE